MAAFPIYSPLICPPGWEPDFTAGSEPCTLQSAEVVTRSRLAIGGVSFFRSVETGGSSAVNNIAINCVVTYNSGTTTIIDDVVFNYTDANGNPQTPITFQQSYDAGSPCNGVNLIDGRTPVQHLRFLLSENPILIMPEDDTAASGYVAIDSDSVCPLASFSGTLADALGLPLDITGIRTGPTYTLMHIQTAETGDTGEITEANALSEWDGVNNQWIAHPSTLYEVGDPAPCP